MESLTDPQKNSMKRQATDKIREIFETLDLGSFYEAENKLIGTCPVHDGDNTTAFNINVDPTSEYYGVWFCNSHGCHEDHGNDIIGLIKGVLEQKTDKEQTFIDAVNFLKKFVSGKIEGQDNLKYNVEDSRIDKIFHNRSYNRVVCRRDQVVRGLSIPCKYYLARGFSKEVLTEFDVGYCSTRGKQMHNRTVFPVYDKSGTNMIGAVGRATSTEQSSKWVNSKGFNTGNALYNYGKAFDSLKISGSAVLVEGQGDILKLWQSGITNCVGLFTCKISDRQTILLEEASVNTLYLALDNDEPGRKGRNEIREKFGQIFNIIDIKFDKHDIGDMTTEEIIDVIRPQINKTSRQ